MVLTNEAIINANRETVWSLMSRSENLSNWQTSLKLKYITHAQGDPGQVGAVSRLTYEIDGREMVIIETITRREEPEVIEATYANGSTLTKNHNQFVVLDENTTKWIFTSEYTFQSIVQQMMSRFMKGAMRRGMEDYMAWFKSLAEGKA